jgi:hypothetical protein
MPKRRMPKWYGAMNARRGELIDKKTHGRPSALTPAEAEEYRDLQEAARGVVEYVHDQPECGGEIYRVLARLKGVEYGPPEDPTPPDWRALNFRRADLLRRKWLPAGLKAKEREELAGLEATAAAIDRWYGEFRNYVDRLESLPDPQPEGAPRD